MKTSLLGSNEIRLMSKIQKGRTEARILLELLIIFSLILIHTKHFIPFWTLPLVLFLIAGRQHALLVLMHESTHKRVSKNKFYNDLVGELIAWNFLAFMQGYRRHHYAHHVLENLNTMKDPDWSRKQNYQWMFPMAGIDFIKMMVRDVLLLNTKDYWQEMKDAKNNVIETKSEKYWMTARITYYIVLLFTLSFFGLWKIWLLYWMLPIFSFLKAIFRIRSIADHFCTRNDHELSRTRTVISSWWDRILIGPCSIGVHGIHHLYPSVPYYNLRKTHELLMGNQVYATRSHITYGYHAAILECIKPLEIKKECTV